MLEYNAIQASFQGCSYLIGSTVPSRGVTIDNRTYSSNIYGVRGCVQTIFVKKSTRQNDVSRLLTGEYVEDK